MEICTAVPPPCTLVAGQIDITTGDKGEKTPINEYQKQYDEQQIKYMKKRVAKLEYQLLPVPV